MVNCPKCGGEVKWQRHLKRHMASRMCKPGPHKCSNCQAVFNDFKSLRRHERSKECRKCNKCLKVFESAQTANAHQCTHQKCPKCPKYCQNKTILLKHWRKKHPETAPPRNPHRISSVTEFKCCDMTFDTGRELHTHKQNTHYRRLDDGTAFDRPSTSNTYKCPWPKCEAEFSTYQELEGHCTVHGQVAQSTSSQLSDSEEEEDEEGDSDHDSDDKVGDPKDVLQIKDAKRLYKQIGVKVIDKAGLARFRTTRERTCFRLTKFGLQLCERTHGIKVLSVILDDVLEKYRQKKGKMQIKVLSKSLDPPIVTPLFTTELYNPMMLLNYVESVLGSKDRFLLDDDLTIDVIHIAC